MSDPSPPGVERLLEHLGDALVACDDDGRVRLANAAARDLLGPLLDRPTGDWPAEARVRDADEDRPLAPGELPFGPSALASGEQSLERTIRVLPPDGAGTPASPGPPGSVHLARLERLAPEAGGGTVTVLRALGRLRRIAGARDEAEAQLAERLRRSAALARLGLVVDDPDDRDAALERLLERARADLPARHAVLHLPGEDGAPARRLGVAPTSGPAAAWAASRLEAAADFVLRRGTPIGVDGPELDPFACEGEATGGLGAFAAVPVADGARILGALVVLDAAPRRHDEADLGFLGAVAAQIAQVLVRAALVGALRAQADELARHRDHLEELVAERTRDLERTHARLRTADRLAAVGTLAAGLGHDVGSLLFPLRCRLEAIPAPVRDASDETVRDALDATEEAAGFLAALSDALRDLARDPLAPRADDEAAPAVHLDAWWRSAAPLLARSMPRCVDLQVDLPASVPPVALDRAALTQIALNLLVNAGRALEPDGGRVRLEARPDPGDPARVALTCADDGPGMPPEVARQAFDPFFTTGTRTRGTGLGLALVHRLVSDAGGEIALETAPGAGARFTLSLPVAAVPASAAPDDASRPRRPLVLALADPRRRAWITRTAEALGLQVAADDAAGDDAPRLEDAPSDRVRLLAPPDPPVVLDPDDLDAVRAALARLADTPPTGASTRAQ